MSVRILLVDDDVQLSAAFGRLLKQSGFDVCATCASGAEATRAVASLHPDLVLMDIGFDRGPDGITVAEELYFCAGVPVVFFSGHFERDVLARASHAGAYGFVTKPAARETLIPTIAMGIAKHLEVMRLKGELAHLRAAVSRTTAAIIVTDTDGRVVFMNEAAAAMVALSPAQIVGRDLGEFLLGLGDWMPKGRLATLPVGTSETGELAVIAGGQSRDLGVNVTVAAERDGRQVAVWTLSATV